MADSHLVAARSCAPRDANCTHFGPDSANASSQLEMKKMLGNTCKGSSKGKCIKNSVTGDDKIQSPSLDKFHLFLQIPVEIRIEIWKLFANEPRLLELQHGSKHFAIKVAPASRIPPPIFHINFEAREEAKRNYTLTNFDMEWIPGEEKPHIKERAVYYNMNSDIVFFGEKSCLSTMVLLFQRGLSIPRVAVISSGAIYSCCPWSTSPTVTNPVYRRIDILQAVHGMGIKDGGGKSPGWLGCKDLKEVFFIVKSKLHPLAPAGIGYSAALRPATSDGLTSGQVAFKTSLEPLLKRLENGDSLQRFFGRDKWVGDKLPKFRFMSIVPRAVGIEDKVYDGMVLHQAGANKLSRRNWEFIHKLEERTSCQIRVFDGGYRGGKSREVGFVGPAQSVAAAKLAILEKLGSTGGDY